MALGPVQMLVVGFEDPDFHGQILAELDRLRESDVVRLIDLLVVEKNDAGDLRILEKSDLSPDERTEFGAVVGALIGYGAGGEEGAEIGAVRGAETIGETGMFDDADVWYVADAIPPGTAAAIGLLEHRWAIPLRDTIRAAGGFHLADAWIHPKDLVAIGLDAAALEA